MAEPWGDIVRLSGDGYYDHINGQDSGDGDPYVCLVALERALDIIEPGCADGVRDLLGLPLADLK